MSDVAKLFKDEESRLAQEHIARQYDDMMMFRERRKKEYEAAKAALKESEPMTTADLVNHPAHYEEQSIRLEPIDFCERLPFCEGNAIKYCFRAGHKEGASELLDLKKAQWYLNRRNSDLALKMGESDRVSFQDMSWLFKRSKGILSKAIDRWANGSIYEGDFWQVLEMCIDERISALEPEKQNVQTDPRQE